MIITSSVSCAGGEMPCQQQSWKQTSGLFCLGCPITFMCHQRCEAWGHGHSQLVALEFQGTPRQKPHPQEMWPESPPAQDQSAPLRVLGGTPLTHMWTRDGCEGPRAHGRSGVCVCACLWGRNKVSCTWSLTLYSGPLCVC